MPHVISCAEQDRWVRQVNEELLLAQFDVVQLQDGTRIVIEWFEETEEEE